MGYQYPFIGPSVLSEIDPNLRSLGNNSFLDVKSDFVNSLKNQRKIPNIIVLL